MTISRQCRSALTVSQGHSHKANAALRGSKENLSPDSLQRAGAWPGTEHAIPSLCSPKRSRSHPHFIKQETGLDEVSSRGRAWISLVLKSVLLTTATVSNELCGLGKS